jgi:ferredoxin
MAKDLTVYAIAGHRGTILAIARANKVPIPFDCQDGECGSCLVKVEHLAKDVKCAISLTEKEKEMLRQLGKITPEEIREAEVNDVAPPFRLACQCFVRDEDIMVSFEGDQTLPVQRPHLSFAAKVYKGGMEIKSLDEFLGYAVRLEEDSSIHYDELGAAMEEVGNAEVA